VARSRPVAHRVHNAFIWRSAGTPGEPDRGRLPHHARSRDGDHLRRRTAHAEPAAALSLGAGRLQGQGEFAHPLPGHRDRHRRIAGAVPHDPVRGERQHHVPGRRGARLGGIDLYRRRLRLLGQSVRHVLGRRAHLARIGRSNPGGHAAGVPVRLSEPQPLARALRAHHRRLARLSRRTGGGRAVLAGDRLGHRAHIAVPRRGARLRARRLSLHPRLRPRGDADPDLAAARGLGDRSRTHGARLSHQRRGRTGTARRARPHRDADRVHGDAARQAVPAASPSRWCPMSSGARSRSPAPAT